MARESKYSGRDHKSASGLAQRLCDRLHDCLPAEFKPRKHSTKGPCGAYLEGGNASLYWLYHYDDHVRVYLYGKHILDVSHEIQKLLPPNVLLKTRLSLEGSAAKSTPCFFVLRTEEQSLSLRPALGYLCEYRSKLGARSGSNASNYWQPPSEAGSGDSSFAAKEGNRISALVNKYERDKKNRECCVRKYKAICSVCGFNFFTMYGEIGEGYIHVHHLTPLHSFKGKAQKIDPIKDMRPVCPNCHEMLHRSDPPYTPEQLRAIIAHVREKASSL